MSDLDGRVVVVTGASRGIGEAAARALAARGAAVALLARGEADCQRIAGEIEAAGGQALGLACDVAAPAGVAAALAQVAGRFGAIDTLVNNAGRIAPIGRILDCSPEDWLAGLQVNLQGAFTCTRALLPAMLAAGGGTVVNVSSGAAQQPLEGWSAYCASKAGLAMFTRSLDLEYRAQGLRVFGFRPGTVDTEMQVEIRASGLNPVSRLKRSELTPVAQPAEVIAWLCGAEADDLCGTEVSIRDPEVRRRAGLPET